MMPADLGETLLPFGLVRERVFVRPSEFLDHFALRDKRTFGLRIPVAVIE
jgi:hypothetical protein